MSSLPNIKPQSVAKVERVRLKENSRRMKGILQQYDTDDNIGYDRMEKTIRDGQDFYGALF